MTLSLKQAAERLGMGHRKLMQRMREKGLLDKHNLPANPVATKDFLVTREGRWYHEKSGMQYPRTTRRGRPARSRVKSYPEPWPRQYARQIKAMQTREERIAALAEVPEQLRELVRTHVEIAWNHPKGSTHGPQTD